MIKFHPHSLGAIMAPSTAVAFDKVTKSRRKPKTPEAQAVLDEEHRVADEENEKRAKKAETEREKILSAGAITFCKNYAKQFVYGFKPEVSTRQMQKGIMCEDESIRLYNSVNFTSFVKNTERKEDGLLTGECDIASPEKIIDIKTSWSLETFHALKEDCYDSTYEWQGRAYMKLWNVDLFELAFCMINTPEELIGYENPYVHFVDHINPQLRVTSIQYERDLDKERLIEVKCAAARKLINELIQQIAEDHK